MTSRIAELIFFEFLVPKHKFLWWHLGTSMENLTTAWPHPPQSSDVDEAASEEAGADSLDADELAEKTGSWEMTKTASKTINLNIVELRM